MLIKKKLLWVINNLVRLSVFLRAKMEIEQIFRETFGLRFQFQFVERLCANPTCRILLARHYIITYLQESRK